MSHRPKFERWYDRVPEMKELMLILCQLSESNRRVSAKHILKLADDLFDNQYNPGIATELGADILKGFLKSQKKGRWYDRDMFVHKAVNRLYMLTPQNQERIARKVVGHLRILSEYEMTCLNQGFSSTEKVAQIILETGSIPVPVPTPKASMLKTHQVYPHAKPRPSGYRNR